MQKHDVIRAWRDPEYYWSLSERERARLPSSPAGLVEIDDEDLNGVAGGTIGSCQGTILCTPCPGYHCAA